MCPTTVREAVRAARGWIKYQTLACARGVGRVGIGFAL